MSNVLEEIKKKLEDGFKKNLPLDKTLGIPEDRCKKLYKMILDTIADEIATKILICQERFPTEISYYKPFADSISKLQSIEEILLFISLVQYFKDQLAMFSLPLSVHFREFEKLDKLIKEKFERKKKYFFDQYHM
jgi:hypothetical protein